MTVASPGRTPLRRRIISVGTVLILAFAASSAYDVWRAFHEARSAATRELTTLSTALAEEAARSFQSLDLVLRDTAAWYQKNADAIAPDEARDRLAALASGVPLLGLTVRDLAGVLRYSWFASAMPMDDVSNPIARSSDRDRSAGFPGADSLATDIDEKGHLTLSRNLSGSVVGGTVLAVVDLEDFRDFYKAIDFGAGNQIVLLRDDGTLVAREPAAQQVVGKRFPEFVVHSTSAAAPHQRAALIESPIDGVRRFIARSPVRAYPFVVVVTRDESVALRAWREQTVHVAVRTLVLSLLGALLIAALVRQLARVDAAEAEKQRLEAQLRQSQKLEAIGTLAGGIAHDFNNILGAILGYSELVQKDVAEGSTLRHYVDQIVQAGARARGLVERILAFSRSGLSERVPVHVQSVAEEALDLLMASLPPHVRLEKNLVGGNVAVMGDPTQLHQVVMNLCRNAVQAMEHGGVLTVALERLPVHERRTLSHGTLLPRAYVRLTISDTGDGIAPAVLDRIFDPFFTTKRVGAGTGLGLSLVHGIVADLGGAIDVESEAGSGATFMIWLPASGEIVRSRGESQRELPRGHGETVMVIDDERPLVALAEEMLAELGYDPAGFDSSTAALQAFRADCHRFDLILTDETMPETSGIELAREIRQLRPDIPVVLMSGYSGAQFADRAREAGINEVLRKPLMSRDIAEAIARAFSTRR